MPSEILTKSLYVVSAGESVLSISLKLGVAPHFLISDNLLKSEVRDGDMLLIIKRGKTKILTPTVLNEMSEIERQDIMKKNNLDYLFAYQIVVCE